MLRLRELSDEQAKAAVASGDFPEDVRTSAENVVVILTQGWCPDWHALNASLNKMRKEDRPADMDIDVYVFVYDTSRIFDEVKAFKEHVLGNREIPYLRLYKNGRLLTEDNYLTASELPTLFAR